MFHFQIQIQVDDNSTPKKFTTGFVYVNVPRDLFNPQLNLPNDVQIEESAQPNREVYDVDATDQDLRVGQSKMSRPWLSDPWILTSENSLGR